MWLFCANFTNVKLDYYGYVLPLAASRHSSIAFGSRTVGSNKFDSALDLHQLC